MLAINSILLNNYSNSKIFFHIVENNVSKFNKFKMKTFVEHRGANIEFININTQKIDKGKNLFSISPYSKHVSRIGTARILLPELLPNLEKVLYLDADILATTDLQELYNTNLHDYYAGMVINIKDFNTHEEWEKYNYFNSGVILINLKEWRKNNITQKCINELNSKSFKYPDQDVLNNVLKNNILKLNFKWNYQTVFLGGKYKLKYPKGILHYISHNKPWKGLSNTKKDSFCALYSQYWNKSWLIIYKPYFRIRYAIPVVYTERNIDKLCNSKFILNYNLNLLASKTYSTLFCPFRNKLIEIPFFEFLMKY